MSFWDPFRDPFFRPFGLSELERSMLQDPFFSFDTRAALPDANASSSASSSQGAESKQVATTGGAADQQQVAHPRETWFGAIARAPRLEVIPRQTHYLVKVDVPGVKKDQVTVTVDQVRGHKVLTVKGERKYEKHDEDEEHHVRRYASSYGSFQRSVSLPDDVADANVSARLEDGVLEVSVPRRTGPAGSTAVQVPIA